MSRAKEPASVIRETGVDKAFDISIHILAVIIIVLVCYPLLYVVAASFSSPLEVSRGNVIFFPKGTTLDAYENIIKNKDMISGYINTVKITVLGTAINIIMTTCCAYPLSRRDLAGCNTITKIVTFTMFFSAGMIPDYLLIKELGLMNSIWSLVLPGSISVYNMLVMRNFFQTSIPDGIVEAAMIDGCGNIQTLIRVVLPLSKAIMAVMLIFYMVGHWNAYFSAMMYMQSTDKYPLQLVLRNILLESKTYFAEGEGMGFTTADSALAYVTIQYACIVVSSLPVLIMYPFMQKYFVKGVMIGAVKG